MAAKQILSLVVASTWVVNLLCDNLKRAEEKCSDCSDPKKVRLLFPSNLNWLLGIFYAAVVAKR